jgi:hypothetical protein
MRLGELNSKKQPNGTYNFVVYELKPIFKGSIAKVEEFIEEMTSLGLSFEEDECTNFFQGNKEFVKKLTSIHESIK